MKLFGTMKRRLCSGLALFLLCNVVRSREIPMKKAIPPDMSPKPTLPDITHRVYFDVEIDGEEAGRIVFGLFGLVAPKAVDNFRALAACDHGIGDITGKPLCYKDSPFHRIIPDFGFQGGDFTHMDGTGGESIYGGRFADDVEAHKIPHNRRFLLSMSNKGKDSNGSQFFVNTVRTQWLDGRYFAFGIILEGQDVASEIEKAGTYGGRPRKHAKIAGCGETPLLPEDKEVHY